MKIHYSTGAFKNYLIFTYLLQVNGSFLSRLKNRYEYLPLSTSDFTVEDMDYSHYDASPDNSISIVTYRNLKHYQDNQTTTLFNEASSSSRMTSLTSSPLYYNTFMSARQQTNFLKRTESSKVDFYYYDQDGRPTADLFALTSSRIQQTVSTTDLTIHIKRTWPSYFPPKFISKLQAELDNALLPWKMKKQALSTVSFNKSTNLSGHILTMPPSKSHRIQASCYMCGLDQDGIPVMPGCYHAFESDDQRQRKLKRHLKVKCIEEKFGRRIKNKLYGPDYTGGCFKRFLDVGIEYNERGCRTKEPTIGKSYASRRLARLERMLKDTDSGCVFSPYASLTPFNRAISLYARYHVCVCNSRYCNHVSSLLQSKLNKLFLLILIVL